MTKKLLAKITSIKIYSKHLFVFITHFIQIHFISRKPKLLAQTRQLQHLLTWITVCLVSIARNRLKPGFKHIIIQPGIIKSALPHPLLPRYDSQLKILLPASSSGGQDSAYHALLHYLNLNISHSYCCFCFIGN